MALATILKQLIKINCFVNISHMTHENILMKDYLKKLYRSYDPHTFLDQLKCHDYSTLFLMI